MSSDKPDEKIDAPKDSSVPSDTQESRKIEAKNAEKLIANAEAKAAAESHEHAPAAADESNESAAPAAHDDDEEDDDEDDEDDEHGHVEAPPASADTIARRQLLGKMSIALGCAGGLALAAPALGFIVAPLFRNATPEWRPIGPLDKFKVGETVNVVFVDASPLPWAGVTSKTAAWLRRVSDTEFEAFSVNCAHLGCPVRWMPEAKLFMCPCHGGVYYQDGSVAAGPPPHALPQYPVRIRDGQVEIRTDPIPIG